MEWGVRRVVAVGSATLLLLLLLLAALPGTSQAEVRRPCDGVRLLSEPLVVTGLADLILQTSGPVDDRTQCLRERGPRAAVAARRGAARGGDACEDAHESGARLRPRAAAKAIRCLIDERRTNRGLQPLESRSELAQAAERHTDLMVGSGCFAHQCPGEPDLVARVTATEYLPCSCAWTVAENIAWGKDERSTPAAILGAWMDSAPHRETLLRADLRDVGVGVRPGAPGKPNSNAATYTADFGVKR